MTKTSPMPFVYRMLDFAAALSSKFCKRSNGVAKSNSRMTVNVFALALTTTASWISDKSWRKPPVSREDAVSFFEDFFFFEAAVAGSATSV